MRKISLFAAAILATTGLVAAGTTEAANAAGSKNLSVQYGAKVIKNESVVYSGTLSTAAARPVTIQYRDKNKGSWHTKKSGTSNSSGSFAFNIATSKTRYFRFVAPKADGRSQITGNSRKVTVVSQKVTVFEISDASQCHVIFDSSTSFDTMTVFTKFYPARPGREVKVVTEKYGTFTGEQDSAGDESFQVFPGTTRQSSTFQARTSASNGASTLYSSTKTSKLTNCVLIFTPLKH